MTVHAEVVRLVRQSPWDGRDAEQFEPNWRQRSRSAFDAASDVLHRASQALRRNAEDQRRTSSADGAWGGSGPDWPSWLPTPTEIVDGFRSLPGRLLDTVQGLPWIGDYFSDERIWARGEGRDQLEDMADRTAEEQLAWWRSLTDEQRRSCSTRNPGGLLALDGLPARRTGRSQRSGRSRRSSPPSPPSPRRSRSRRAPPSRSSASARRAKPSSPSSPTATSRCRSAGSSRSAWAPADRGAAGRGAPHRFGRRHVVLRRPGTPPTAFLQGPPGITRFPTTPATGSGVGTTTSTSTVAAGSGTRSSPSSSR